MHHVVLESLRLTTANYLLAGRVFVDAYFQQLQRSDLWPRVEYLGVLPPHEVGSLYQRADVGLVLLDYSPNVGYHKGTLGVLKMFEYMMAGLPVVATDFELWKEVVEGHQCGICVNPHDPQAVASAVNHILSHPDIAQQMGNNGRKAVETLYNWATQEPVLLELYEQVLGNLLPTPDNSPYSTLN
jgi:glycosyltransferase involved in cell wall biosynthesis